MAAISIIRHIIIRVLSAAPFVPTVAGLWWKKANVTGGIASLLAGLCVYLVVQFAPGSAPLSAILFCFALQYVCYVVVQ
ncbi:MAG: hypothetical protein WBE11_16950 [Candidatus Aminicenantaceae bacterium]